MKPEPGVAYLHVANGLSTTMTIEAAGIPGACSIWADPLYDGPVPSGLSDHELLEARMQFLAGHEAAADSWNDMREWRAAMARHETHGELVLWFEHDLFDQLNLIHVLTWIRAHLPAAKPVSLICLGAFPGRPDFKGLGELTTGELAPLFGTRQPVSEVQYELARRAWQAFRAPTPEAIVALLQEDTSALPFLAGALRRLLQDYPWTTDGLSRTERRLMELSSGDGIALWQAFPRMHEGERAYYLGDGDLAEVATTLAKVSPALLTLNRSGGEGAHVLHAHAVLTETGRSVLAGAVDRVAACGIDRWLGGVHLHAGSRIWRWDDTRARVV